MSWGISFVPKATEKYQLTDLPWPSILQDLCKQISLSVHSLLVFIISTYLVNFVFSITGPLHIFCLHTCAYIQWHACCELLSDCNQYLLQFITLFVFIIDWLIWKGGGWGVKSQATICYKRVLLIPELELTRCIPRIYHWTTLKLYTIYV
jgi:hypothetical protein